MGYISDRLLQLVALSLYLGGTVVVSSLPSISITNAPTFLQANYQMQITCIYDSTVYQYNQWVTPNAGGITVSYGRYTVVTNVQAGPNQMYYRLQISNPLSSDAGTYYCVFTTIGGQVSNSASVSLVWMDPPLYSTPTGLVYRQFVQQSVLLVCNATNYGQLQWQYSNGAVVTVPSPDRRVQKIGTSLYFSSLLLSDAATYLCVTNNAITVSASIQATLVVYEVPSVQVDSISRVVNTSGHANFTCTARGAPQPTVIWTRENSNNNLVLSTSHVTVTTSKTSPYVVISTIDFPSVTGNDTGVYRCTAQNSNGSSYVNVNLLLYGTPTAPTNVNVATYNGSTLIVSWGPPVSNGNLNLISYTVYWQAGRAVNSVTLSGFPPPTQYLIGGLDYLTNYSVSVVANNARGKGYSSSPFLASTAATVPSTPVNFTVEDLGSTSATISWALSDDGGSPVTMTYLSYKTQGNRTPVYVRVTGDTSEYHLTGLDFNSSLTVSLSAANAMGEGPTALFSFSTTDVPDAPPYITSSTVQDAAAVCWPSTSLGQPYLLYRVKVQAPGSALDGTMVDIKPTSATQSNGTTCVKITSLLYDTCYNFTVLIQNDHGFSLPVYSTQQACTHAALHSPVLSSSQSRAQVVAVASGTVGAVIGLTLLVIVGVMVGVALVNKKRVPQTGDRCLDSVNSSTADTCKSSNSSSSLAYKTEGHTPNSSTALLTETPFTFPTQQSALIMEYPQHTSMLSVGYYSQDVTHMGLMGTVVAQSMEEEVDDDGLTENPAFAQQGMEHKDNGREMWHSAPPPYSGESHSQASPPPMFVVPDSDDCTAGDGTMFVENNAYETHEFQPIPEPADNEPRFAITNSKRGEVREMVEFKSK